MCVILALQEQSKKPSSTSKDMPCFTFVDRPHTHIRACSIDFRAYSPLAQRAKNEDNMPALDFSGVKELVAIPAGNYKCAVADVKYIAKPKNNSAIGYYEVKYTVSDEDSEHKGRSVYKNFSLKPEALFAMKKAMVSAGTDPEKFTGKVDLDEEWKELIGAEVTCVVSVHEWNGEDKNQVDRVTDAAW